MYIKLEDDLSLSITESDVIRRGDNLSKSLKFLLPETIADDIATDEASVYLSYIRADGAVDVVILTRLDELYEDLYYQFVLPITCKITKYPGTVVFWLQIYNGLLPAPQIAKSGEMIIQVLESTNIDDYMPDVVMTAYHQLKSSVDTNTETLNDIKDTLTDQLGVDWDEEDAEDSDSSDDGDNTGG